MKALFRRVKRQKQQNALLLYSSVQDIIATHSVLQKEGLEVSLVPPPLEVAIGCDLAVQFTIAEEEAIKSFIAQGRILPGNIHRIGVSIKPVNNLVVLTEIEPDYLMATSYNIKVTIDVANHEIVNISGGGCPDIPYVAHKLVGLRLEDCPEPMDIGSSLCTYMVQLSVDKLRLEVTRCW